MLLLRRELDLLNVLELSELLAEWELREKVFLSFSRNGMLKGRIGILVVDYECIAGRCIRQRFQKVEVPEGFGGSLFEGG